MSRSISVCSLALAAICASSVLASAQVTSSSTEADSTQAASSPVAFVYVSSNKSGGTNVINGYSAAANGSLTPIPGSPFPWSVNYLALNGAWLFGIYNSSQANGGQLIDSFLIGSNGALAKKDEVNVADSGGGAIS